MSDSDTDLDIRDKVLIRASELFFSRIEAACQEAEEEGKNIAIAPIRTRHNGALGNFITVGTTLIKLYPDQLTPGGFALIELLRK